MNKFTTLFTRLDETNKTLAKQAALVDYFKDAPPADAAWAVYFLSGRKLKRLLLSRELRAWGAAEAGVPDWLFEASYEVVGDLAETLALLLPPPEEATELPLKTFVEERLLPLKGMEEGERRAAVVQLWRELDRPQRFVAGKLMTGSFRVGVSQRSVIKALAIVGDVPPELVAHRMMGTWEPTAGFYTSLTLPEADGEIDASRPYPFFLAHPTVAPSDDLDDANEYFAEWKWDGIRSQVIRRQGQSFVWSRGEELIGERFPEILAVADALPDGTALDGEIVIARDGDVQSFAELQRRIGRKTVGKKLLKECPAHFVLFDVLEAGGEDVRNQPLERRRECLAAIAESLAEQGLNVSPSDLLEGETWEAFAVHREHSRSMRAEGLMLKRKDAPYGVGRVRGPWWKWKVDPYTVDGVMLYAQRGHGRRASLYTDYTFGVWDEVDGEAKLVPFAKAYSGLTDKEIGSVDKWIRRNTVNKFGPVREVKHERVFELAFENIQQSTRHKSGIAVRFPRIVRIRDDKIAAEADTLDTVKGLVE
ncbi:ATP-dependent DNA ligase [Alienimonas chondri]|uniref:DNA ligase (ATP) n=1 Tax=Alienimonas chondri TaxID=2681879 RepID=A0ABX1V950_9PLAN|nr:ATP-dependent DNA ligase [Alienimonas chondri]NNJ24304.1 DNA ligase [Alienimonas chondri]